MLAACTPPGVELEFHDAMIGPVGDLDGVDAVALTVQTFTAHSAYALAARCRARGVPVIMGGFHPSAVPHECGEPADAVVVGEAEDTWPRLLADLAAGTLQPRYVSRNDAPLASVSAQGTFDRRRYPALGLVQFSRGCRYSCDFCSIHAFYGHHVRTKAVADALAEIAARPERHLFFVDDNLFADRSRARELFAGLVGLGKRWVCQITMDVAADADLLALMRRAGCFMVLIGFESLERANLVTMKKGANLRASSYDDVVAAITAAGLMIYGTFVLGYDHDTPRTGDDLVAFATKHAFSIANFNPLMPMPGTALEARLRAQGRLTHERWWLDADYRYGDAMLAPAQMTPDDLTDACARARFAFYSPGSVLRRTRGPNARLANLGAHLAANLISGREIRAKQGEALGGEPA